MPARLLEIHPQNPQPRFIQQVVECLQDDGVIIYPTDTVYALGCAIGSRKAVERIARIRHENPEKVHYACILPDLKDLGTYTTQVSTPVYKLLKAALPGPFTFILKASDQIPKYYRTARKTVGVRVIDHPIPHEIVRLLGQPLLTASIKLDADDVREYPSDPYEIFELHEHNVDIIIDAGFGGNIPSTVIDCSEGEGKITVVRQGLGDPATIGLLVEE